MTSTARKNSKLLIDHMLIMPDMKTFFCKYVQRKSFFYTLQPYNIQEKVNKSRKVHCIRYHVNWDIQHLILCLFLTLYRQNKFFNFSINKRGFTYLYGNISSFSPKLVTLMKYFLQLAVKNPCGISGGSESD